MKHGFGWLMVMAVFGMSGAALAQPPGIPLTEEHKLLKHDVGTWDAQCKVWGLGPDGPVIEGQGAETNRLLGNGLWLISDFKGNFGGLEFEGHGTFGYDPEKKKYVGSWVDSMSTYVAPMEGTYDPETKSLTLFSEAIHPSTGKKTKSKNVDKSIDENTRLFTTYNLTPGTEDEWVKTMEIRYKRRAKDKDQK